MNLKQMTDKVLLSEFEKKVIKAESPNYRTSFHFRFHKRKETLRQEILQRMGE